MAKDSSSKNDPFHPILAPLFTLGQTALDELDHQGERWLEYGAAQVAEGFRVARGVRSQLIGAAGTMLASAGELVTRSLDASKTWTAPFSASPPAAAAGAKAVA